MARSSQQDLALVLVTAPDPATAEALARAVVDERLAACATVLPGATSFYRWEGEVRRDPELQLLMKTRRSLLPDLCRRVVELHPYDVPEVVGVPIEQGLPAYCRWVLDETDTADDEREGGAGLHRGKQGG